MASMITAWMDQLRDRLEGSIDFEGQKKAELYTQWILVSAAIIGFLVGFALQNLLVTLGIFGAGFVIALVVVCPPWPMYNKNPISWLPADPPTVEVTQDDTTTAPLETKKTR